ncbi:MAG TPA: hypothetical protein VKX17_12220 [Planctomycetota bacterium]|nr:hypothetical protein [Planctomycetota bacterium]
MRKCGQGTWNDGGVWNGNPLNNDPNAGTWTQQDTVTKSKTALTGFTSGARIWVRVRGIGPNGSGEWCDPATSIVP